MVKAAAVNVQIRDAEFKAFAKSFNELSDKMKVMTQQWKTLGLQINNTASQIDRITSTIRTGTQHLANWVNTGQRMTKTIVKWGGLIGGIVTLLGGGSFLGMDKIAQRMVDMRRNLLGLGGADYGKTQATLTFGKGLMDDPKSALAAIRRGQTNVASDEARALAAKGFTREQVEGMDANDLLREWLKRTAKIKDKSGRVVPTAVGQKEHTILSEDDIRRIHGDQGQSLVESFEKRAKSTQGLTDDDLTTWTKFWESVTNFKNKIDTEWIKALEPLAPAGTHLIEAITKLTESFLKWDVVTKDIEKIAKGIEWLANFMENPSWKEAWNAFEYFFKQDIEDVKKLLRFLHLIGPGVPDATAPSAAPPVPSPGSSLLDRAKAGAKRIGNFLKTPVIGSTSSTGGPAFSFSGGSSTSLFNAPMRGSVPSPGGGGVAPMPAPFSFSSGPSYKFSSAVQSMAPTQGGAVNSVANTVFAGMGGGGGGGKGPLDSDNWQSSRTASLVVRGVPSANLFLTAAGMTG
jgi:hypothetical protein